MKAIGILILLVGLILGAYAITMDVGVDIPARDLGYGISTPGMQVANIDRMAQRQNYIIFSGILAIVGAILTGFASMRPDSVVPRQPESRPIINTGEGDHTAVPSSVSICPKCRHMGKGDAVECERCGSLIGP